MGLKEKLPVRNTPEAISPTHDGISAKLDVLKLVWSKSNMTRERDGIYPFLEAVFEFVTEVRREGRAEKVFSLVSRVSPSAYRTTDDFAAVLHCVTPLGELDSRTRSKWARALAFAERKKGVSESLQAFVSRCGGINMCASWPKRR